MKVSIGPITGVYKAKVILSEQQAPASFKMAVHGSGTGGTIAGEGVLTLAEKDGGTEVTVRGDAQVGGVVARVGQRLLGSAANGITRRQRWRG
jgi:carbon monoxide dehydrogenase subunit G